MMLTCKVILAKGLASVRGIFSGLVQKKGELNNKDIATTMNRKAFTMIELVFVIVLIGILTSIAGNIFPDNRLLQYTNEVSMKIKETQKNAIGNDVNGFEFPWKIVDNNATCIELNSSLHVTNNTSLCFDEYGRPYQVAGHLLLDSLDINVAFDEKMNTLSVMPMSGYVIIED